jgi:thiamine monophosphate synthase
MAKLEPADYDKEDVEEAVAEQRKVGASCTQRGDAAAAAAAPLQPAVHG